jgi:hypothetical protein
MPDSIMFQEDAFVVLETNQPEQIITTQSLLEKLKATLATRRMTCREICRSLPL